MKNIVVATDHSYNAANATLYAAALARAVGARLVLFHAYPTPLVVDAPPDFIQRVMDESSARALERLGTVKKSLEQVYDIQIDCRVAPGTPSVNLPLVMQKEQADLLVMGFKGINPALKAWMGSTTTDLLRKGNIPLLIVPAAARFHTLQHILFACDDPFIPNEAVLNPLIDLISVFSAELDIYRVEKPSLSVVNAREPRASNLETHFHKIKHVYLFDSAEDVHASLIEGIATTHADILAMIPHHRSIWGYLLDHSMTIDMARDSTVPVLALAEKTDELYGH